MSFILLIGDKGDSVGTSLCISSMDAHGPSLHHLLIRNSSSMCSSDAEDMREARSIIVFAGEGDTALLQLASIATCPVQVVHMSHTGDRSSSSSLQELWSYRTGVVEAEMDLIKRCAKSAQAISISGRLSQLDGWVGQKSNIAPLASPELGNGEMCFDATVATYTAEVRSSLASHLRVSPADLHFSHDIQSSYCDEDDVLDEEAIATKPPALHWSPSPMPSEVQLTWRWNFNATNGMPMPLFRELITQCRRVCASESIAEYEYRWTEGLLVVYENVKVHVHAVHNRRSINIAARVDVDELDEEGIEGDVGDHNEQAATILRKAIGPYLLTMCNLMSTYARLPYTIHVIPFGDLYYRNPTHCEHSFHLHELLAMANRRKAEQYECHFLEMVTIDPEGEEEDDREMCKQANSLRTNIVFDAPFPQTFEEICASLKVNYEKQTKGTSLEEGIIDFHVDLNSTNGTDTSAGVIRANTRSPSVVVQEVAQRKTSDLYVNNTINIRRSSFTRADSTPHNLNLPTFLPIHSQSASTSPDPRRRGSYGGRRVSFSTVSVEGVRTATLDDPMTAIHLFVGAMLAEVYQEVWLTVGA